MTYDGKFYLVGGLAKPGSRTPVQLMRRVFGYSPEKVGEAVPEGEGWNVLISDFSTAMTGRRVLSEFCQTRAEAVAALWRARDETAISQRMLFRKA